MKIKSVLSSLCLCITTMQSAPLPPEFEVTKQPVSDNFKTITPAIPFQSSDTIISNFNASLARFIRERYNEKSYAKELSQNGTDLITLLALTYKTNALGIDRITYSYTILKLMHEKMKSWQCKLIDDTVVHSILSSLPALLGDYFTTKEFSPFQQMKYESAQRMEDWARTFVNTSLDEQRKTIHTLPSVVQYECSRFRKEIKDLGDARAKLRGMVVRLTELMLSKITWSMSSYESIWPSVQTIGYDLQRLFKSKIFNDEDDLDSALWSLVHGFCSYLDIVGPYIPLSAYKEMASDITHRVVSFLEQEEQDDFITTKKDTLIHCLVTLKPRVHAFQKKGILLNAPII